MRRAVDGTELARQTLRLPVERLAAARATIDHAVATPADAAGELLEVTSSSGVRAIHFFVPDRDLQLEPARLEVEISTEGETAVVDVTAHNLVKDLYLFPDRLAPAAEADEAGLVLLPGERRRIRVTGVPADRAQELADHPVLRTLNDLVARS